MPQDRISEAVRAAAAPTLERIRYDSRRASHQLAKLLRHVGQHLLDPELGATRAWRRAGIRDHSLSLDFKDLTGVPLRSYIETARMEIAERLVRSSDLEIGVIGLEVGYTYHSTFSAAFKRRTGKTPGQAREAGRQAQPANPLDGQLSTEAARDYLHRFHQAYPNLAPAPSGRVVVDGARYERLYAEDLWRRIRDLPFAEQQQEVRQYLFCSTVLFDLLRRKSREEGRLDRRRGIEIAELALLSLENSEAVHGERLHDLRAYGWAWLGNAHCLALDFAAADRAFEQSTAEWYRPRAILDQRIFGRICNLHGTLRMFQRRYLEALELVERSQRILHAVADPVGELRSLIQAASVHIYCDRWDDGLTRLDAASSLLKGLSEPYLDFAISANRANLLVRLGHFQEANENLDVARRRVAVLMDPLNETQLFWIDANIQEGLGNNATAEELYFKATSGFATLGHSIYEAMTWLDVAILYSENDRWAEATRVASLAAVGLASHRIYPESWAAVELLARTLQTRSLSNRALRSVRSSLRTDPLVYLME